MLQAERRKQEDELKQVREQEEHFERIKVRALIYLVLAHASLAKLQVPKYVSYKLA